jgi:cell division protein DivIC
MTSKKKYRFKYTSLVLSLLFLGLAVLLFLPVINEVITTFQLKQSITEVKAKLKDLEAENAQLSALKAKLQDEDYIISYARGVYMLSKDGEKIFYLPTK